MSGEPFYDAQGGFLGYRGTARDVTERKAAEERMRQLNASLRMAMRLTRIGVGWLDAADHSRRWWNGGRVVAQGSVAQIRSRVAQRRVRCLSRLDAAHVAAWPHVTAATRDGDRLEIVAEAAEAVVYRLLTDDPTLSELEVSRAGLADAFVEITKEAA